MMDVELWPADTGKTQVQEPRIIECPTWECTKELHIDSPYEDELAACFSWEYDENVWLGAPTQFSEPGSDCNPEDVGDCVLVVYVDDEVSGETGECVSGCSEGTEGAAPPDECCYESDESDELEEMQELAWDGLDEELETYILETCEEVLETQGFVVRCEIVEGEAQLTSSECPQSAVALTPGADFLLEVDELASYLTLSGLGAASTGPVEFLTAIVDAEEDGVIGSTDYKDWRFWFTTDIAVNGSGGSFTVPYQQGIEIEGRGMVDDDWAPATFEPTANATGGFDGEEDTWYLDYTSTFTGGWVTLHLEGPTYGTSTP